MPAEEIHPVRRCQANAGACPLPHNQGNTGICTQGNDGMVWVSMGVVASVSSFDSSSLTAFFRNESAWIGGLVPIPPLTRCPISAFLLVYSWKVQA